ncbi:hypothetical protein NUM3379_01240 [Kineococcus sp. NUM-3379]
MDSLAALGRMSVSLVAVVGLVWLITRWLRKGGTGAPGGVTVLSRTAVGHKAGVAVVQVGNRALVVGVTEHQVSLLGDVPLETVLPAGGEEEAPGEDTSPVTTAVPTRSTAFAAELALKFPAAGADVEHITHTGEAGAPAAPAAPTRSGASSTGRTPALAGSALSPATWNQALHVLRERTARR